MKGYSKLVRDLIPQIIEKNGELFTAHWASSEELPKLLEDKLQEEVKEYVEDKNLEELVDILEVVVALADNLGYSEEELFNKRLEKRASRGGFKEGIVLDNIID